MRNRPRTISKASILALMASIVVLYPAIFVSGGQLRAQDATGQDTLTNADVVKMVQAPLSADIIVYQLHDGHYKFSFGELELPGSSLSRLTPATQSS